MSYYDIKKLNPNRKYHIILSARESGKTARMLRDLENCEKLCSGGVHIVRNISFDEITLHKKGFNQLYPDLLTRQEIIKRLNERFGMKSYRKQMKEQNKKQLLIRRRKNFLRHKGGKR